MKEHFAQIIAAILLGLLMPGIVIRLTERVPAVQPEEIVVTQPENITAVSPGIWVQTDEGQTQWMILEEYLTGVILAEMPTSYSQQALCAQAVAARTYALKRQQGQKHLQGAVCTDPACCQAYVDIATYLDGLGYPEDVEIAQEAAVTTAGLVLTYEGSLIEATYFHSSGGKTEASGAIWGTDYPYLRVVDSLNEDKVEKTNNQIYYNRQELESLLNRALPGTPGSWVGWVSYTVSGAVDAILFAGIQYGGTEMRSLLKLNSTVFTMVPDGDGLWIYTQGKGHRVGMSQVGAQAMALENYNWQQILSHYYPGTRIDKMEDVE